jgi:hypothetical protein
VVIIEAVGVVTRPTSTTSIPTEVNPAATADASIGPLRRESLPRQTVILSSVLAQFRFRNVPNALPYTAAIGAVRLLSMMPRIPLILMINSSAISTVKQFKYHCDLSGAANPAYRRKAH